MNDDRDLFSNLDLLNNMMTGQTSLREPTLMEKKAESVTKATDNKASEFSALSVEEFYDELIGSRSTNFSGDQGKGYGEVSRNQRQQDAVERTPLEQLIFDKNTERASQNISNKAEALSNIQRDERLYDNSSAFEYTDDAVRTTSDAIVNSGFALASLAGTVLDASGNVIDRGRESLGLGKRENPLSWAGNVAYNSKRYNDWSSETERDGKKAHRRLTGARDRMRDRDINSQNSSTAGKVYDQFVEASKNILTNPSEAVDVIANATGSLVSFGVAGKMAQAAGASSSTITGITMAMNGIMEAGSNTNEVLGQLYSASESDLMNYSEDYKARREIGMNHIQAVNSMAMFIAPETTVKTFPLATATSVLNARFEGNLFNGNLGKVGNIKGLFSRSAKESAEEGVQEANSSIIAGQMERDWINRNKDIYEDLGESISQGMIGGAGMVGVTQPKAVLKAGWDTATTPIVLGAKIVSETTSSISNRIRGENEKEAPTSKESVIKFTEEAIDNASNAKDSIDAEVNLSSELNEDVGYDPEEVKQGIDAIVEVMEWGGLYADTLSQDPSIPDTIKQELQGSTHMSDLFEGVKRVFDNPASSIEDKNKSAALAVHMMNTIQEAIQDVESIIKNVPDNTNAHKLLTSYVQSLSLFEGIPQVKESVDRLNEYLNDSEAPKIDQSSLDNGTIDDDIAVTIAKGENDPTSVNLENTTKILEYANAGLVELSPQQEIKLRGINSLLQAERVSNDNSEDTNESIVSRSIRLEAESSNKDSMPSAREMVKDITNAVLSGDMEYAVELGKNLTNFARHFNSKVDALNRSVKSGKKEPYNALSKKNGDDSWYVSSPGLQLHPNNQGSVNFANSVLSDSKFVATLNNELSDAFPELNIPKITPTELDSSVKTQTNPSTPKNESSKKTQTVNKGNNEKPKDTKKKKVVEPLEFTIEEMADTSDFDNDTEIIKNIHKQAVAKVKSKSRSAFGYFHRGFEKFVTYIPNLEGENSERVVKAWEDANIRINKLYAEKDRASKLKKEEEKRNKKAQKAKEENPKSEDTKEEPTQSEESEVIRETPKEEIKEETVEESTEEDKVDKESEVFKRGIESFGLKSDNLIDVFTSKNEEGETVYDSESQNTFTQNTLKAYREMVQTLNGLGLSKADLDRFSDYFMSRAIMENMEDTNKASLAKAVKGKNSIKSIYPNVVASEETRPKRMNAFIRGFFTNIRSNSRLYNSKFPFMSLVQTLKGNDILGKPKNVNLKNISNINGLVNSLVDRLNMIQNTTEESIIEKYVALNERLKNGKNPMDLTEILLDPSIVEGDTTLPYRWSNGRILNFIEVSEDGTISLNREITEIASIASAQFLNDITEFVSDDNIELAPITRLEELPLTVLRDVLTSFRSDEDLDFANFEPRITGDTRALAQGGIDTIESSIMDSLSSKISQYLGYRENTSVGIGLSKGVITALAGEYLDGMVRAGLLIKHEATLQYKVKGNDKVQFMTITNYEFNKEMYNKDLMDNKEIIDRLVLKNREPNYSFTKEGLKNTSKFKDGDFKNPLLPKQVKAKEVIQSVPFHVNNIFNNLVTALGRDGVANFLYPIGLDPEENHNINHLNTLLGQRMTIIGAFNQFDEMNANIKNEMGEDYDLANGEVYFGNKITRENRYHYLGGYNPQNNELLRNLLTIKTRDRKSVDSSPQLKKVYELALAQSLGIKVNNLMPEEYVKQMYEMLDQVPYSMNLLLEIAQGSRESLGEGEIANIREEMEEAGMDISLYAIQALFDYANYLNSQDNGTEHFSNLYVEADGVTSGTVNAMMILGGNMFSPEFLESLAMGGIFFGEFAGMTNNEYRSKVSSMDIYRKVGLVPFDNEETAQKFKTRVVKSSLGLAVNGTFNLLADMIPGVSLGQDGELLIGRTGKGDVTTSNYGSGVMSMATNTLTDIVDLFYEKFSPMSTRGDKWAQYLNTDFFNDPDMSEQEALNKFWGIVESINHMASFDMFSYREAVRKARGAYVDPNKFYKDANFKKVFTNPNFKEFTFNLDGKEMRNVRDNIAVTYTSVVQGSIEKVISTSISDNLGAISSISTALFGLGNAYFNGILEAEIEKVIHDKDSLPNDFLSQDSIDYANDMTARFIPRMVNNKGRSTIYKTGKVIRDLKGSKNPKGNMGSTLDDKHKMAYKIDAPIDPGVSALPFFVIGNGDASHIDNSANHNTHADQALYTHDGVETHIEITEENSYEVNREIMRSWSDNSFTGMYNTILGTLNNMIKGRDRLPVKLFQAGDTFLRRQPYFDAYADEVDKYTRKYEEIGRTVPKKLSRSLVIKHLAGFLLMRANRIQATAHANAHMLRKTKVSIDQNASANNAYYQDGLDINSAEYAEEYQKIFNEYYTELDKRRNDLMNLKTVKYMKLDDIYEPTGMSTNELNSLKETNENNSEDSSVPFTSESIESVIENNNDQTTDTSSQTSIDEILNNYSGNDSDILFIKQLKSFSESNDVIVEIDSHENLLQKYGSIGYSNDTNGFYDPSSNKIVISTDNDVLNVLAHEMIHATTYKIVDDYFSNDGYKGKNSDNINRAIEDIVSMMEEFKLIHENEDIITDPNLNKLIGILNSNMPMADKLNEFMAWGITNESAKESLNSHTRSVPDTFISRLKGRISNFMKSVMSALGISKDSKSISMLSNLKFNTLYLAEAQAKSNTLKDVSELRTLYSNSVNNSNNKKVKDILNKVMRVIDKNNRSSKTNDRVERLNRMNEHKRLLVKIGEHLDILKASGFNMTVAEEDAIRAISYVMGTNAQLNSASMQEVQKLYSEVMNKLTVEDFMKDPNTNNPNDRFRALSMYNAIQGRIKGYEDQYGRDSMLPTFIALGTINPEFRSILSKIDTDSRMKKGKSFDSRIGAIGSNSMERLNNVLSGYKDGKTSQIILDGLVNKLLDSAIKERNVFAKSLDSASSIINVANDKLSKGINKVTTAVYDKSIEATKSDNVLVKAIGVLGSTAGVLSNDKAGALAESVGIITNRGEFSQTLRELMTDFIGMTSINKNVIKLTKLIKSNIQRKRQEYREDFPRMLAESFEKELTDKQWETLTNVVSKVDISSLIQGSVNTASTIFNKIRNDRTIQRNIEALENELSNADPNNWNTINRKANELAQYLVDGTVAPNLLRNANAVANLSGESTFGVSKIAANLELTNKLDELITLRALTKTDREQVQELRELLQSEEKGMNTLINYIKTQIEVDKQKSSTNGMSYSNGIKGYTASIFSGKGSVIVADDSDYAKLKEMSYVRLGDYKGTNGFNNKIRKGYYYSPVSKNPPFHQGIMQNVRETSQGVDMISGASNNFNAGLITDKATVRSIYNNMKNSTKHSQEHLVPIYAKVGDKIPVAYEMTIDPTMLSNLQFDSRLHNLVGARSGRTFEESVAEQANSQLIDSVYKMMEDDYHNNPDSYVNIFDPILLESDPVLKDAVNLIPKKYKDMMLEKGQGEFLVRRDVLNDVFGYRMATIGDAWTGTSRWDDKVLEEVKNLSMSIMGNKAYSRLMSVQATTQNLVQSARNIIVVKSMIVPAVNLVSNILQSLARGISLPTLVRELPKKLNEINNYVSLRKRLIQLELDMNANPNDINRIGKIKSEIKTIESTIKRLTIYPLIKAGEFTSISESIIENNTTSLVNGKWDDYFEGLVDKLPSGMRDMGKQLVISKDTALYKGLQMSVDYGDFLTKAIYYDHLVGKKGMDSTTALEKVSEEYVNYDRLQGRTRHTLENIGMLWFYNWKIRATKIALSLIRDNPLTTLMSSFIPMPDVFGSVGIPTDDSLIFKLLNGESLWGSIGPGMGLRAPTLNPFYNVLN